MSFFLDGFFNSGDAKAPGKIIIEIPTYDMNQSKAGATQVLTGLLSSEPTFVTQNKWGPIISDVSNLTDLGSLFNSPELFSWVSASTLCWKGTEPIKFNVEFYLINYSRDVEASNSSGLQYLVSLTALGVSESTGEVLKGALVAPHGGYAADIFADNTGRGNYFSGLDALRTGDYVGAFTTGKTLYTGVSSKKGTATVTIGNSKVIPNVLVSRIDVTPSLVEVISGSPLYYRVGVSFTGATPLTVPESNNIFST